MARGTTCHAPGVVRTCTASIDVVLDHVQDWPVDRPRHEEIGHAVLPGVGAQDGIAADPTSPAR